ncbi:MAG: flagellar export chaperone FliS [Deltaproteobacteria bacterium]|nr:flagellar export chaperone FliS [Deltaproteobacteria bacterium]
MSGPASILGAAARYKNTQVKTCSPAELVLMLFDGVIRFTTEAEQAMSAGDRARTGERIDRALAILEELTATLDPSHGAELCANLASVYDFCAHKLLQGNLERNPQYLREAITAIRPIREGWAQILGKP